MQKYRVYYRTDWMTSDWVLSASDIGDAIDRFTKATGLLGAQVDTILKVELIEEDC